MSIPELDGTNCLKFYYIDLFESVCRIIQDPSYADKLYHSFEMQTDSRGDRVFQKANSGRVFESSQLLDPLLLRLVR